MMFLHSAQCRRKAAQPPLSYRLENAALIGFAGLTRNANFGLHLLVGVGLAASVILLYVPVFLHPHWGTFDDALLILQPNRRLLSEPGTANYVWLAGLRSGIFFWVTVLWRLFPEQPMGFYAINCLLFFVFAFLVYLNSIVLTRSVAIGVLAAVSIFFAPGLFEVVYTLDKQELYLPLLFSTVITMHMLAFARPKFMPAVCALCAIATSFAVVSKETSISIAVFSCASLIGSMLTCLLGLEPGAKQRLKISAAIFTSVIVPFLILRLALSKIAGGEYASISLDFSKIAARFIQYAHSMPSFFLLLGVSIFGTVLSFKQCIHRRELTVNLQHAIALLAATVVSSLGLMSFNTYDSLFFYIWLPVYSYLLPVFAYGIFILSQAANLQRKLFFACVLGIVIAIELVSLPEQILKAQFQFGLDDLTAKVSTRLANLSAERQDEVIMAMPTFTPEATEIPENIECFVRSKRRSHYYGARTEAVGDDNFSALNFLSTKCFDDKIARSGTDQFILTQFRGQQITYTSLCPADYVGWSGYQILATSTPFQRWVKRPFARQAVLVVPYGNLPYDRIIYRGAGLFANTLGSALAAFPQLEFKELWSAERRIRGLNSEQFLMGWKILLVKTAAPVSTPPECRDGLLKKDDKLYVGFDERTPILAISVAEQPDKFWSARFPDASIQPLRWIKQGDLFVAKAVLKKFGGQSSWLQFERPGNVCAQQLHAKKLELVPQS